MISAMIFAIVMQSHDVKQAIDANIPRVSIPRPVHEPVNISKTPYDPPPTSKR